jgi:hypothetical protein
VKGLIAFVLAMGLVVAGAAYLLIETTGRAEESEMNRQLNDLRLETSRQVALLANSPDDKVSYDRQQTFRKHLEGVGELRKKYPDLLKEDAYINNMEEAANLGTKDKAKTAEYRARYDYVKQMYEQYIKVGAYKPVLTGVSNGLRYDVVSMKKSNEGGKDGMRWDVIMYGAPSKDQLQLQNMNVVSWLEFPELETKGPRKGQPKRTVVKGDFSPMMPYVWVDKPWMWMPEWPANVTVGYYLGIPQWDSRAKTVDLTLTGAMRTEGGSGVPINMAWKKLPVDSSWKGSPGGAFDNPGVVPLSDEDLKEQGVNLPEEEAAAAAAAAAADAKKKG